jgi:type I restriction enzyme S subunit
MKDSGIEWLGEIPEHWKLKKIKYVLQPKRGSLKTGPFGSQLKASELVDKGYKVYNQRSVLDNDFQRGDGYISEHKFKELREFEILPNDVLITTRGTIGRCAVFPEGSERGVLHPCLIRIQFNQDVVSNEYISLFIQESESFKENVLYNSNATTIEVIYGDTLKEVKFPLPDLNEQKQILTVVWEYQMRLANSISLAEREIELLKEYRTALISEAVTGKFDVRNSVIGKNN